MYAERDGAPLRKLNAEIRSSSTHRIDDLVPFFCECLRDDCFSPVWLTLEEYDSLVTTDRSVTAAAHNSATLVDDLAVRTARRARKVAKSVSAA